MSDNAILLNEGAIEDLREGIPVVIGGSLNVALVLEGTDPYVPAWAEPQTISRRDLDGLLAGNRIERAGKHSLAKR